MGQRQVHLGCEFIHSSQWPVAAVFQVEPRASEPPSINAGVTLNDVQWNLSEGMESHTYLDLYGNTCRRVTLPEGESTIAYSALATVPDDTEEINLDAPEIPAEELPDDVLLYTMPSRFCLPDELGAEAWRVFGQMPKGYQRVQSIVDYTNKHLTFQYGSSNSWTTARDVYESGYGVCRDFAHLAITFCRALNIPARYVFGYLPDMDVPDDPAPMDFAAWMQVWLGDRWYTFDARNNRARKGRVLIGVGRDASDVAMVTTYGAPWMKRMTVVAQETTSDHQEIETIAEGQDPAIENV